MRNITVKPNRLLDAEEVHLLNAVMKEYNDTNNLELLVVILGFSFIESIS